MRMRQEVTAVGPTPVSPTTTHSERKNRYFPMRSVTVLRKGGRTESTYVPPKALTALGRYERARRLHRHATGPAYWLGKAGPITGWGVYQIVGKRAAAAGVPTVTVHQLRHHWAHTTKATGMSDEVIRVLGGWSRNSRMLGGTPPARHANGPWKPPPRAWWNYEPPRGG